MNNINMFKHSILAVTLALASNTVIAADVGVSINVGQPGFYGRIDIGEYPYPQPRVIYRQPIIVHRHYVDEYEPIYLRVPPGHAKRWNRYCGRYDACDRPVYFVQERWYRDDYVPQYREYHGIEHEYRDKESDDNGRGHKGGKGKNKHNRGRN